MADQKRERGRNFSEIEKSQLVEIVLKYKDIIENKRSDKISLSTKSDYWNKITAEFNALQSTGVRESKALKALYEALKAKARKEKTNERVETMKTGGGPFLGEMSQLSARIVGELGVQFEPLPNKYDSSSCLFEGESSIPIDIVNDTLPMEVVSPAAGQPQPQQQQLPTPAAGSPIICFIEEEEEEHPAPAPRPVSPGHASPAAASGSKRRRTTAGEPTVVMESYSREKINFSQKKLDFQRTEHQKRIEILNKEEEIVNLKLKNLKKEEELVDKKIRLLNVQEETARIIMEKEKIELEILKLKMNRDVGDV